MVTKDDVTISKAMPALAEVIDTVIQPLPGGPYGWLLFIFPFGSDGQVQYIGSQDVETNIKVIDAAIARLKEREAADANIKH